MNNKGLFFTTIVILLGILLVVSFTLYDQTKERKSVQQRVSTMNNFLFSTEQDLQRQAYTAGFRAIFLFEKRISDTGTYIDDVDARAEEVFLNGTLYGSLQAMMIGATFSDMEQSIQDKADKLNINITLDYQSFTLTQESPWKIKTQLVTHLLLQDKNNLALWNKTETIIAYVNVEGFEDPFYTVETLGIATNKINRTRFTPFAFGTDVTNLTLYAQNSMYINSTDAPSFLQRLEGINLASQYGIESIVNPQVLSSKGVVVEDKVVIDHIYFSSSDPAMYQVTGMPSWFKIDNSHLDFYGVANISYPA